MWWNKTKKQEDDPELTQAIERVRQMIIDAENPKPKPIDEAAIEGFKIHEQFEQFLTKCEAEIGKDAAAIGVADTADEGGGLFVHKDLQERIEKEDELDKLQLKLALANYPIPNSSYQFNMHWPQEVAKFHGLLNSEEVIRNKAAVLAIFVIKNLDIALNFYDHAYELNANWIFEGVKGDDEQRARIELEEASIWARIVAELCPKFLVMSWIPAGGWKGMSEEQKNSLRQLGRLFVDYFWGELAFHLGVQGFRPSAIFSALNDRAYEYGAYHEWVSEIDKSPENTLFWEAPKRVGELFGGSAVKNVEFITAYAGMFMKRVRQAQIAELMTGLSSAAESPGISQTEKK